MTKINQVYKCKSTGELVKVDNVKVAYIGFIYLDSRVLGALTLSDFNNNFEIVKRA